MRVWVLRSEEHAWRHLDIAMPMQNEQTRLIRELQAIKAGLEEELRKMTHDRDRWREEEEHSQKSLQGYLVLEENFNAKIKYGNPCPLSGTHCKPAC